MPENPLKQAPSNNLRNINMEKSASGRYSLKENTKSTDSSTCCKQRLCCVPKKNYGINATNEFKVKFTFHRKSTVCRSSFHLNGHTLGFHPQT